MHVHFMMVWRSGRQPACGQQLAGRGAHLASFGPRSACLGLLRSPRSMEVLSSEKDGGEGSARCRAYQGVMAPGGRKPGQEYSELVCGDAVEGG